MNRIEEINARAAAIREEIGAISKSRLELEGKRTRAEKETQEKPTARHS